MIENVFKSIMDDKEPIVLYRRCLSDVKFQIAQNDELENEVNETSHSSAKILELTVDNDVVHGIYEGGLKTWECSLDLVEYLSIKSKEINFSGKKILELGCGSALPGIYLLSTQHSICVDFQDYNEHVLKLVTIPNILINTVLRPQSDNISELDILEETNCLDQLKNSRFFKGDWNGLTDILNLYSNQEKYDIILSSETIYNLDSIPKLYNVIKNALKYPNGIAYIAAKTIYFGVGGGILSFCQLIEQDHVFEVNVVYTKTAHVRREILKLSFL
ncbi:S-adenosylmethionine-dependent methyltransferase [Gigaspora margarita]|uniref:protein-histidine N-methyltransferase n=1 Tax=Gigaspora margarita TaxID=4874 RepID=A0A8H4ADP0_GIGMA|nr:S-adenosylmethionine-dependent methyltransferase [Gigaspora margarita]